MGEIKKVPAKEGTILYCDNDFTVKPSGDWTLDHFSFQRIWIKLMDTDLDLDFKCCFDITKMNIVEAVCK